MIFVFKGWGFRPITNEGDKSNNRRGFSLSSQFLKSCQKEEVTAQFQNKCISVSFSLWQKLQRLLSIRFNFFQKSISGKSSVEELKLKYQKF